MRHEIINVAQRQRISAFSPLDSSVYLQLDGPTNNNNTYYFRRKNEAPQKDQRIKQIDFQGSKGMIYYNTIWCH